LGQEVAPRERFGHSLTANVSLLMWPTNFFANFPLKRSNRGLKIEKQILGGNLKKKTISHISKLTVAVTE
jgi:hypothetical protein